MPKGRNPPTSLCWGGLPPPPCLPTQNWRVQVCGRPDGLGGQPAVLRGSLLFCSCTLPRGLFSEAPFVCEGIQCAKIATERFRTVDNSFSIRFEFTCSSSCYFVILLPPSRKAHIAGPPFPKNLQNPKKKRALFLEFLESRTAFVVVFDFLLRISKWVFWGGCTWLKQWSIIKFILSLFLLTHNYSFLLEFHYLQFRCLGFISGCWSSNWLAVCSLLVAFQPHGHFRVCHLCCGLPVGLWCRRLHRHRPDQSWRHCFPSRRPLPPPRVFISTAGFIVSAFLCQIDPPGKCPPVEALGGWGHPHSALLPVGAHGQTDVPPKKIVICDFAPLPFSFFFFQPIFFCVLLSTTTNLMYAFLKLPKQTELHSATEVKNLKENITYKSTQKKWGTGFFWSFSSLLWVNVSKHPEKNANAWNYIPDKVKLAMLPFVCVGWSSGFYDEPFWWLPSMGTGRLPPCSQDIRQAAASQWERAAADGYRPGAGIFHWLFRLMITIISWLVILSKARWHSKRPDITNPPPFINP